MDDNPVLVIRVMKDPDRGMRTEIGASDLSYEGFGLLICDAVRHGAKAFGVTEEAIWNWVDRERYCPTTKIDMESPN